ncbi:hypothetical protein ACGFNX_39735 [Streptomyces sp. NPDC048723]|uniref:hypothetical protein n=1 Tax=Streptomyces sp. NPDC048723 TaxID=3365589 RepID=UPI00370FD932
MLWQVTEQGSGGWRMDTASTTSGEVLEEHVFPAGIGFTVVDHNKPVRGWFTAHGRGWLPAQPDTAGTTLKTFYRAGARARAGFAHADALTDPTPADFDAEVVTTTARRWRADVRAYGLPDRSMILRSSGHARGHSSGRPDGPALCGRRGLWRSRPR